jgi:flagellar hook-associated protein FlgK
VKLTAGTVNAGDSFQVNVAANPDTAGILPALGLNSFFTGSTPGTFAVNPALLANPGLLAASKSGEPGDSSNVNQLVALGNQNTMAGGTQTFNQFLANLIGNVGTQVQDATNQQTAYNALGAQLQNQLQSNTGVDSNGELIKLVQYQQSYEMSAKYVSMVSQTLDQRPE